jgi:hypothetical protein
LWILFWIVLFKAVARLYIWEFYPIREDIYNEEREYYVLIRKYYSVT